MVSHYAPVVLCMLVGSVGIFARDYQPETQCSRAGGICLQKDDCSNPIPPEYLNLCPLQKGEGVECCHGHYKSETRCKKLGGECFESGYCHGNILQTQAKDCPGSQICCVLVN